MNSFPNNLKRLRKASNLKQEDLAERLHVTRQTVSGWETGRRQPDIEMLKALAEALDTDIHVLIYGVMPGEYPRYQRKYVIWTCVCGGILSLYLLFRIFFQRNLIRLCNAYFLGYAKAIILFALPEIPLFAAGLLLPAVVSLYVPVQPPDRCRRLCRILGALFGIPSMMILFQTVLNVYLPGLRDLVWFCTFDAGRALLLYCFPFCSGLCLFAGYVASP